MRNSGIVAVVFLLAGCLEPSQRVRPTLTDGERLTLQVIRTDDPLRSDAARVTAARLEGDDLAIDVQFGGGCRPHLFGIFTDGKEGLSNPPFVMLYLVHEANDDPCDALLARRVTVDLRPLQSVVSPGGTLIVRLVEPQGTIASLAELLYHF
jgi:hypothetical protein